MIDAGIFDGDTVIIARQNTLPNRGYRGGFD